jgi:transposase
MIPISADVRVWIATGHTDMRRGMQGLGLIVQEHLKRDPHGGDLFVFRGPLRRSVQDPLAPSRSNLCITASDGEVPASLGTPRSMPPS